MSKKLTAEYIRLRTKCEKLEGIKNLNLWGCDLDDISIIRDLPNLEVVSLSINKIKTLRDFAHLKYLRELYIRKNMVSDINDVNYLKKCSNLRTLWLNENPLAEDKNYRAFVIKTLPQIVKLDDVPITNEERSSVNSMNFDDVEINEHEDLKNEPEINFEEEIKYEKKSNQRERAYTNNNNNYDEKPINSKNQYTNNNNNYDERPASNNQRYNNDDRPIGAPKNFYRQNTDNLYSAKRNEKVEKKQTPSPNTRQNYDVSESREYERKKYRPERDEEKPIIKAQNRYTEPANNKGNVKSETVLACIFNLMSELSIDDVEKIKKECERLSSNYYDN